MTWQFKILQLLIWHENSKYFCIRLWQNETNLIKFDQIWSKIDKFRQTQICFWRHVCKDREHKKPLRGNNRVSWLVPKTLSYLTCSWFCKMYGGRRPVLWNRKTRAITHAPGRLDWTYCPKDFGNHYVFHTVGISVKMCNNYYPGTIKDPSLIIW